MQCDWLLNAVRPADPSGTGGPAAPMGTQCTPKLCFSPCLSLWVVSACQNEVLNSNMQGLMATMVRPANCYSHLGSHPECLCAAMQCHPSGSPSVPRCNATHRGDPLRCSAMPPVTESFPGRAAGTAEGLVSVGFLFSF